MCQSEGVIRKAIVVNRKDVEKAVKAIFAHVPQRSRIDEAIDIFERLRASPPKQERSLETLNRLLDAAEKVLEEEGLDAATVPAIAKRAAVSVGVVYRRFPNKEALIRGVYERYLWRIREQNGMMLSALAQVRLTLPDLIRGMVRGSVEANRRKRNLVAAINQFVRTSEDAGLRREAAEINKASTAAVTALMLRHRDQIRHPDPEAAIEFAILMLAAVVRATIIDKESTYGFEPPDDLEDELTRMITGYLGIEPSR